MVGEYFFSPSNDRVHNLLVFGYLTCGVEIGEASERCVGLIEVFGFVDLVELLESVPRGSQPGMSVEEPVFRGCAKTWVLAVLVVGVGSCYEDSAGCVVVVVGEPVGDAA